MRPRWPVVLLALVLTGICASAPSRIEAQDRSNPRKAKKVKYRVPHGWKVRFQGRVVDLRPHLEGFPFNGWQLVYKAKRLFYFHEEEQKTLLSVNLNRPFSLAQGDRVSEIDFNKRTISDITYHAPSRSLLFLGDERNDERMNLYRLDLKSGQVTGMTDKPYIYGYGVDKQDKRVGFLPRYGSGEPYRSCLSLIDMETGQEKEILCDTKELAFRWSDVNFRPDGSGVVFAAQRFSDRNRAHLVYVDLDAEQPAVEVLTREAPRHSVSTHRDWLDGNRFFYLSDENGFNNVYLYDLKARTSRPITGFKDDVLGCVPMKTGEKIYLATAVRDHDDSELFIFDPEDGSSVASRSVEGEVRFLDVLEDQAGLQSTSADTPLRLKEIKVRASGDKVDILVRTLISPPPKLEEKICRCDVERVAYPTFDIDPETGKTRLLDAFLFTPKRAPADPGKRVAVITSFYGGRNSFSTEAQILCDAGIMTLSPAVRGSGGFGAAFKGLNDSDLGGNEILDVIYGGKYLMERFALSESQIGVKGKSHGGYAAMRLMTFPGSVNGNEARLRWGFGISVAGFSNILTFYESCNIPDWVTLEAGDPETERDKLLDRSPLTHAGNLLGPLLLIHGSNDKRVPVEESRRMAARLKELGKPCTYIELAGLGHAIKGAATQRRIYEETLSFIEKATGAKAGKTSTTDRNGGEKRR